MCAQMLMHVIAWKGVQTHVKKKQTCTESWLWDKNPLPQWRIEPVSAACRSHILPTELHPYPTSNYIGSEFESINTIENEIKNSNRCITIPHCRTNTAKRFVLFLFLFVYPGYDEQEPQKAESAGIFHGTVETSLCQEATPGAIPNIALMPDKWMLATQQDKTENSLFISCHLCILLWVAAFLYPSIAPDPLCSTDMSCMTNRVWPHHQTLFCVWLESIMHYSHQTQNTVRWWSQSLSAPIATDRISVVHCWSGTVVDRGRI